MTATTLIYQALTEINKLESGQTTSPDVNADCLAKLNAMIDSWLLDKFMVFCMVQNVWPLVTNQQTYTIGPTAADFIGPRPTQIQDANILLNNVQPIVRVPIQVINVDVRSSIPVDQINNSIPQELWYVKSFDVNGSSSMFLWPGPQSNYGLELFTWQQLQRFADLTTDYTFPPGYELCLRMNLAIQIYPMMRGRLKTQEPDMREVMRQARESKDAVSSYNAPVPVMPVDGAFRSTTSPRRGAFNYTTGMTGRNY